jgi:LmbE family N-acetylglucosaminyl deacetylase
VAVKRAQRASIVVLSPHRDDAVLSVGGLLQTLGPAARVATVFSRTAWTKASGHRPSQVSRVTRMRSREDAQALRTLRVPPGHALGLPEALLRGHPWSRLFDSARVLGVNERRGVSARVCAFLMRGGFELVIAPLGLGAHIDHRLLHEAAAQACIVTGIPVVFYEDLPYARGMDARAIDRFARAALAGEASRGVLPVAVSSEQMRTKVQALCAYASQLDRGDLQAVAAHHRERGRWSEWLRGSRPALSLLAKFLRASRR